MEQRGYRAWKNASKIGRVLDEEEVEEMAQRAMAR
jgi:hypothetical protein